MINSIDKWKLKNLQRPGLCVGLCYEEIIKIDVNGRKKMRFKEQLLDMQVNSVVRKMHVVNTILKLIIKKSKACCWVAYI